MSKTHSSLSHFRRTRVRNVIASTDLVVRTRERSPFTMVQQRQSSSDTVGDRPDASDTNALENWKRSENLASSAQKEKSRNTSSTKQAKKEKSRGRQSLPIILKRRRAWCKSLTSMYSDLAVNTAKTHTDACTQTAIRSRTSGDHRRSTLPPPQQKDRKDAVFKRLLDLGIVMINADETPERSSNARLKWNLISLLFVLLGWLYSAFFNLQGISEHLMHGVGRIEPPYKEQSYGMWQSIVNFFYNAFLQLFCWY